MILYVTGQSGKIELKFELKRYRTEDTSVTVVNHI